MNFLFHILFNYTIVSLVFGVTQRDIWVIVLFSVILDLDHLPYIIKNLKTVIRYLHFGSGSRTTSHELIGLTFFSIIAATALIVIRDKRIVQIAILCLILHYAIDFIIGRTRPLHPYSKTEVFLQFYKTRRQRFVLEALLTIAFGGIFFLSHVQR
ncbi:MAG: hypothetical protein EPN86_03185 [Nanoarchaeota archaeon]|nr:MAG: hypothetical protein EPN86_03185 [Nanoarchaeota archaeon]